MNRLKEFRKSHGLSQNAMARKIGITLSMYEKVESGRVGASAAFMRRLKNVFSDINIDFIFFGQHKNTAADCELSCERLRYLKTVLKHIRASESVEDKPNCIKALEETIAIIETSYGMLRVEDCNFASREEAVESAIVFLRTLLSYHKRTALVSNPNFLAVAYERDFLTAIDCLEQERERLS